MKLFNNINHAEQRERTIDILFGYFNCSGFRYCTRSIITVTVYDAVELLYVCTPNVGVWYRNNRAWVVSI
jgi:hypothetical protein